MMKKYFFLIGAGVMWYIFIVGAASYAGVPDEISYQGRLREYGQPVTGNRTMVFKIYPVATGGVPVWSSGDVVVSVTTGTFNYVLTPGGIDWRLKDYWLETTISGKILSPREKLTAQVYAIHSRTSEDISKSSGPVTIKIGDINRVVVTTTSISVEGARVVNVSTPVAYDDSATKGYVDGLVGGDSAGGAVNLSASTQTKAGGLNIGGTFTAPKIQVSQNIAIGNSVFLSSGSSSFIGAVNVSTPVSYDNPATKGYVENWLPVGTILMWGGSQASIPNGWLLCNGSAISRTTYSRLFAAIGTTHGVGDGMTTFNLPDLRDRFIVGAGQNYAVGNTGGANTVALTVNEIPAHNHGGSTGSTDVAHTHTINDPGHSHTIPFTLRILYASNGSVAVGDGSTSTSSSQTGITINNSGPLNHTHTIPSQGGGQAHENRPPYFALCYIIKY